MSIYRVRGNWGGPAVAGPSVGTWYFDITGGTPQQAATAVGNYINSVKTLLNLSTTFNLDTAVDQLNESNGVLQARNTVSSFSATGTQSGTLMPQPAQGLVQWITGQVVGTRFLRGRLFLPGMNTTSINGGEVDSAVRTTIAGYGATLIADANSVLVCWSRTHGVKWPVVSNSMWSEWAVLRSRRA